jgi:hypothetical protein
MSSPLNNVCPRYVLISVLTEWLDMKDFGFLDSGLCNKADRHGIFHSLSLGGVFEGYNHNRLLEWNPRKFGTIVMPVSSSYYVWLKTRNLKVSSVMLTDDCLKSATLIDVSKLQNIYIHYSSPTLLSYLLNIIRRCPQLMSFRSGVLSDEMGVLRLLGEYCKGLISCVIPILARSDMTHVEYLLCHCPELKQINFDRYIDDQSATLLSSATQCLKITDITLHRCPLNHRLMAQIGISRKLQSLCIVGCSIADQTVFELASHLNTGLHTLTINSCRNVTDKALKSIGSYCTALTNLNVGGLSCITDYGIIAVCEGCRLLKILDYSGSGIFTTRSAIAISCCLLQLERVHFGCETYTVADQRKHWAKLLFVLALRFTELSVVDFKRSVIGGHNSGEEIKVPDMAQLDGILAACDTVDELIFRSISDKLSSAKDLCIRRPTLNFCDVFLSANACLTTLKLEDSNNVLTDDHLYAISLLYTSLVHLSLSSIITASSVVLEMVFESNRNLLSVNIASWRGLTDATVQVLAENCKYLQKLNVSNNPGVSDVSIIPLASIYCHNLTSINLWHTGITSASVRVLLQSSKLMTLHCDKSAEVQITQ